MDMVGRDFFSSYWRRGFLLLVLLLVGSFHRADGDRNAKMRTRAAALAVGSSAEISKKKGEREKEQPDSRGKPLQVMHPKERIQVMTKKLQDVVGAFTPEKIDRVDHPAAREVQKAMGESQNIIERLTKENEQLRQAMQRQQAEISRAEEAMRQQEQQMALSMQQQLKALEKILPPGSPQSSQNIPSDLSRDIREELSAPAKGQKFEDHALETRIKQRLGDGVVLETKESVHQLHPDQQDVSSKHASSTTIAELPDASETKRVSSNIRIQLPDVSETKKALASKDAQRPPAAETRTKLLPEKKVPHSAELPDMKSEGWDTKDVQLSPKAEDNDHSVGPMKTDEEKQASSTEKLAKKLSKAEQAVSPQEMAHSSEEFHESEMSEIGQQELPSKPASNTIKVLHPDISEVSKAPANEDEQHQVTQTSGKRLLEKVPSSAEFSDMEPAVADKEVVQQSPEAKAKDLTVVPMEIVKGKQPYGTENQPKKSTEREPAASPQQIVYTAEEQDRSQANPLGVGEREDKLAEAEHGSIVKVSKELEGNHEPALDEQVKDVTAAQPQGTNSAEHSSSAKTSKEPEVNREPALDEQVKDVTAAQAQGMSQGEPGSVVKVSNEPEGNLGPAVDVQAKDATAVQPHATNEQQQSAPLNKVDKLPEDNMKVLLPPVELPNMKSPGAADKEMSSEPAKPDGKDMEQPSQADAAFPEGESESAVSLQQLVQHSVGQEPSDKKPLGMAEEGAKHSAEAKGDSITKLPRDSQASSIMDLPKLDEASSGAKAKAPPADQSGATTEQQKLAVPSLTNGLLQAKAKESLELSEKSSPLVREKEVSPDAVKPNEKAMEQRLESASQPKKLSDAEAGATLQQLVQSSVAQEQQKHEPDKDEDGQVQEVVGAAKKLAAVKHSSTSSPAQESAKHDAKSVAEEAVEDDGAGKLARNLAAAEHGSVSQPTQQALSKDVQSMAEVQNQLQEKHLKDTTAQQDVATEKLADTNEQRSAALKQTGKVLEEPLKTSLPHSEELSKTVSPIKSEKEVSQEAMQPNAIANEQRSEGESQAKKVLEGDQGVSLQHLGQASVQEPSAKKPLAMVVEEARPSVEATDNSGTQLSQNSQQKQAMDLPKLGKPLSGEHIKIAAAEQPEVTTEQQHFAAPSQADKLLEGKPSVSLELSEKDTSRASEQHSSIDAAKLNGKATEQRLAAVSQPKKLSDGKEGATLQQSVQSSIAQEHSDKNPLSMVEEGTKHSTEAKDDSVTKLSQESPDKAIMDSPKLDKIPSGEGANSASAEQQGVATKQHHLAALGQADQPLETKTKASLELDVVESKGTAKEQRLETASKEKGTADEDRLVSSPTQQPPRNDAQSMAEVQSNQLEENLLKDTIAQEHRDSETRPKKNTDPLYEGLAQNQDKEIYKGIHEAQEAQQLSQKETLNVNSADTLPNALQDSPGNLAKPSLREQINDAMTSLEGAAKALEDVQRAEQHGLSESGI